MFIKISEKEWVNLHTCRLVLIHGSEDNWNIGLHYEREKHKLSGFKSEDEAREVLDEIWEAYREGKPYFEPDPREKLNVRLGDKWYGEEKPIDTYIEVIQRLGLEKIEKRQLIFKDKSIPKHEGSLIVTKDEVPGADQKQSGEYYILSLHYPTTMKETLEYIASELGVEIKVTIYR